MKVGTGRGFSENLITNLRSPAREGLRGLSVVSRARTKKKRRAYPSYLERFVKQTASDEGLALLKRPCGQRSEQFVPNAVRADLVGLLVPRLLPTSISRLPHMSRGQAANSALA
jgi:hypothetical protein